MYRSAVLTFAALALHAHSAHAGDKDGCKDPSWAPQRLPGFEISECETKSWASLEVNLAKGSVKLDGEVTTVTYTLTDEAKNPTALKAKQFYQAEATKAGAKVVSNPHDGYNVVLEKKGKDDVYYLYEHGSGNEESTGSYTLTTIKIAALDQLVVAQLPKAPLDTQATKCEDPPWLKTNFPAFKLARCTPRDFDQITFETKTGTKTLAGRVLDHTYELTDESKNPVAANVQKNFIGALEKIGAKLVSKEDDVFTAILTQKTSFGELWYIYRHGAGSGDSTTSFDLTTIEVGGPAPKGCKLEIYGVHFDTDKATLRPDSTPVLEEVLAMFKADPKLSGELSGHTDDVGDKAYNQKLSQNRADAVKAWLAGKGIDGSRITTKGYGDTRPLVKNDSDEHRQKNRRVELVKNNCK